MKKNIQMFKSLGVEFEVELGEHERTISESIRLTGAWEANQLSLYKSLISKDGTFVDIGANVGVNSIFAKKTLPCARVVSIEPSYENFDLLLNNLRRASCSAVEAHNIAIASTDGVIGFVGSGTNAHLDLGSDIVNEVKCSRLDTFCDENNIDKIDLLKIDVEGYTDVVLSGSQETFRITNSAIVEFSHEDTAKRLSLAAGSSQPLADVVTFSTGLAETLRGCMPYVYYIARSGHLVEINITNDIFYIMFLEHTVGDILFARTPIGGAVSAAAFSARIIRELLHQNHLRRIEIQALQSN